MPRHPILLAVALATAVASSVGADPLPDLIGEISPVSTEFDAMVAPGDVAEGCATATSGLELIRFGVLTTNIGTAPLVLGDPQCPSCSANPGAICGNPEYECSPAGGHMHPHFIDYAKYELLDATQTVVGVSGKRGFCLEDTSCPKNTIYSCEFQGLSPGCGDLYNFSVGCQYIEVNGVPDGDYTLRVTVDPLGLVPEANEGNNVVTTPITLQRGPIVEEQVGGHAASIVAGRGLALSGTPVTGALPSPAPTQAGMLLGILDTGTGNEVIGFLGPEQWHGLGNPPGSKGFRFRGGPNDPCRTIRLTPTRLRMRCPRYGIPPPVIGDLRIRLTVGTGLMRYCASFGGTTVRNDSSRFRRIDAPAVPCS